MSAPPPPTGWPLPSRTTRALGWLLNPGGAPSHDRLKASVAGKVVLVTGGSSGVGEAAARLFASAGATVLLLARSADELERVATAIRADGGTAVPYPTDLTDPDAVAATVRRALADHGRIDVLVNNAGKSIRRSVALQADRFHDFQRTVGVNYLGPVRLALAVLPGMRRRKYGHLVNVSTFAVRVPPVPRWGAYQASKGAFETWFRSIGVEVRGDGVATTSVHLPLVYTRMSAPTPSLRGVPGLTPDQAAGLVARAVVRRSRTVGPWWLGPTELFGVLARRPVEWAFGVYFRRSADSPAALGLTAAPKRETPNLRRALKRAGLVSCDPRTLTRMARAVLLDGGRPSALCELAAARHPDRVAVADDFGPITYTELARRSRALAAHLRHAHGVGPDRGLAVLCRNHRGFLEALLAGSALGADVVLLNTEFPGPQLAQALAPYRLGCLIHDAEFAAAVAASGFAGPRLEVAADGQAVHPPEVFAPKRIRAAHRPGRIVLLTSGTTGPPKGAGRTPRSRALAGPLVTLLDKTPLHAGSTVLIAGPLFHGFGLSFLALTLLLGGTLVVRRRMTPAEVLATLAAHRVEVLAAVPTLLRRLLDVPEAERSKHDLTALSAVLASAAPLGPDLCERTRAAFGPVLFNLYGSSETGFGAIATPADLEAAPGTVGYPPAGTDIRLLDPDGSPVPAGTVGRVFVQTRLAFAGYTGGGSREVIDGHMDTGDLGHLDPAGRLFIDGRSDDMIVSGGENVFPGEVEELLAAHPAVKEVAVGGVPDAEFGQRLRAWVVPRDGTGDAEVLKAYLRERLPRYKLPRDFVFLAELPRTATGKVMKRHLPEGMSGSAADRRST